MSDIKIHEINPELIDRLYPAIYMQIVEGTELLCVKDMKILRDMVNNGFNNYISKMEDKEHNGIVDMPNAIEMTEYHSDNDDDIDLSNPDVYLKASKDW